MPSTDSPALIVARYLKSNNYTETYDAFVAEAGLSHDAGNVTKGDLDLETLLDEKKNFDIAVKFEKLGLEDENTGWRQPSPEKAKIIGTLPTSSNILSASVEEFSDEDGTTQQLLLATTADKRINILNMSDKSLQASHTTIHDAPALSATVLGHNTLLTTSMSGQLHLSSLSGKSLSQRRDHSKYVVKVAILDDKLNNTTIVATAGWDTQVVLYSIDSGSESLALAEPTATIPLQTKPEALLFTRHPENNQPVLILSRTDSNNIFFYSLPSPEGEGPRLLGQQNLAPHSNAWVAFTPSALELSPIDPTLLAVGTSSIPHMKLLLVRLLYPPYNPVPERPAAIVLRTSLLDDGPAPAGQETQASQARAELVVAEREFAAIQIHATTMAPQTAYSTPAVAWRPDGSGIWVNGDDGAVRGIEASTGKVVCTLREGGHEPGSKVRCLWAGNVRDSDGEGEKEVLVSGGFDRRLIVWEV
ncbi:Putative WD40/YVTN repeat-like-containing domain superfamily [Septoria linicola]|uniref:WD40/YVTN repeat-like-containing domain superfamily n=1 Tax=Septoria linicola TaxID=215465 RepID=A0A9Q9ALM5_9PEZI|nr:putative WD40/YVTN repeat-like-containing domain superfamily [Septoria linicola]USW48715.1 Putative WD40/YVTN repeat-like-containing domain superfamily [Septoria linicola]